MSGSCLRLRLLLFKFVSFLIPYSYNVQTVYISLAVSAVTAVYYCNCINTASCVKMCFISFCCMVLLCHSPCNTWEDETCWYHCSAPNVLYPESDLGVDWWRLCVWVVPVQTTWRMVRPPCISLLECSPSTTCSSHGYCSNTEETLTSCKWTSSPLILHLSSSIPLLSSFISPCPFLCSHPSSLLVHSSALILHLSSPILRLSSPHSSLISHPLSLVPHSAPLISHPSSLLAHSSSCISHLLSHPPSHVSCAPLLLSHTPFYLCHLQPLISCAPFILSPAPLLVPYHSLSYPLVLALPSLFSPFYMDVSMLCEWPNMVCYLGQMN